MLHTFKYKDKEVNLELDNPHIEGGMANGNFYEQKMLDWIEANVEHGRTYLDIGAYIGNHSVFFALYCADYVHAFEPVFTKQLIKNIRLNGLEDKINAIGFGLGSEAGKMGYVDRSGGHNPAATSLIDGDDVLIERLDDFIDDFSDVRVIKLDVEGMELDVLKGGRETIEKFRPHCFVEAVENKKGVDRWFAEIGYKQKEKFNATPTYRYYYE